MPWINPEGIAALLSLTVLEIALGADNFLHIRRSLDSLTLESRLSAHRMISVLTISGRILLVVGLVSLLRLPTVYTLAGHIVKLHEIVLLLGACILTIKVAFDTLRIAIMPNAVNRSQRKNATLGILVAQIVLLDLFLSIDSAVTAVAMAEQVWVMISALITAELIMYKWANAIDAYIKKNAHITTVINAFTLMLGMVLFLRANGGDVPMGLLYCILLFIVVSQLARDLPNLLKNRRSMSAQQALPKKPFATSRERLVCETPMKALVGHLEHSDHLESSVQFELPRWSALEDDTIFSAQGDSIGLSTGEIEYQFYSFEPRQE